jgi:nitroreductase
MKVVASRRSVRKYTNEPLPEEDMRACLRAALLAPTSSNLQCWEFHWVKSAEKKSALIKACLSQSAASTAAELIVAVARTRTWPDIRRRMLEHLKSDEDAQRPGSPLHDYYTKIVPFFYSQGPLGSFGLIKKILFFIIGFFRPVPREPTSLSDMRIWATKTTALACENLMLALRARGYDSCPMEGMDSSRVRKILQLPRDAVVVMVISAGKRAPRGIYGKQIRFDEALFIKEH